jgi:LPS export ABC transporter protein LptC
MRHILLLVAVVAGLSACKNSKAPPVVAGPTAADSADQVFLGMRTVLTTKGVQRAELTADTAFVLEDQTKFDMRRPHVNFTTELGAPQGTMDAQKGIYSTRTQILVGWGDVVVRLVDGRTLKSPHVVYNQIAHQITSDTSYTIIGPQGSQYGIGFTSNQTFTSFQCARSCGGNMSVLIPER